VLREAEAKAARADDVLLTSKIMNYRAIDQLNQRRHAEALALAERANAARAERLRRAQEAAGPQITAAAASRTLPRTRPSARELLVSMGRAGPEERATVLSAQGHYVAGAAARALGKPEAATHLEQAARLLTQVRYPPAWLTAQVAGERARLRLAARDPAGAIAIANSGLTLIRRSSPGARAEAHLLLTRARAQHAAGQTAAGLASGREAVRV
jgi:hypothetical protein